MKGVAVMTEQVKVDLSSLRIPRDDLPHNEKGRKGYIWLFIMFIIIAALIGGYLFYQPVSVREVEVFTVIKKRGEINLQVLTAGGYIAAKRKATISSKISGRIEYLEVEEGDFVKGGEVIARLDSAEFRAQLKQAEAILEAAKANLSELLAGSRQEEIKQAEASAENAHVNYKKSEMDLKRTKRLYDDGVISSDALDSTQAKFDSAQAQLESARQNLNLIKAGPRQEEIEAAKARVRQAEAAISYINAQIDNTIIRAPFSGTVLKKNKEVGESVLYGSELGLDTGASIVTIADLKDMEVEVDISEGSISKIKPNQPAEVVADAYPDKVYRGRLVKILPSADRQKAVVRVKVKILEPDEYLKPDMSTKVTFFEDSPPSTAAIHLSIPSVAIIDRDGKKIVFVVKDLIANEHEIRTGTEKNGKVEVLRGLNEGDTVVIGGKGLKAGERVKIKQEGLATDKGIF
jgi:HlyD family secretion protein